MPVKDRWAEIRASIKKDAHLQKVYTDGKGKYCVLGGLAVHDGLDLHELIGKSSMSIGILSLPMLAGALAGYYGLDPSHLYYLQHINDSVDTTRNRRRALLNYIDSIDPNKHS